MNEQLHSDAPGSTEALDVVEAPAEMRGLVVLDPYGHRVGEVERIVVDSRTRARRMLVVGSGGLLGLGRVYRLVPFSAVVETTDHVRIAISHLHVHATGALGPDSAAHPGRTP